MSIKYDKDPDSPSKDWTIKELKQYIREKTDIANERIESYKALNLHDPVFERVYEKVARTSGVDKNGKLKATFYKKHKSSLVFQARRLQSFMNIDTITPQAIRDEEAKVYEAWQKFMSNNIIDMSLEDYEKLTDAFGTLGDDILGTFKYMGVVDTYLELSKPETGKKIDLVWIIERELKKHPGIDGKKRVDNIIKAIREGDY